jgi:GxxExxY protein
MDRAPQAARCTERGASRCHAARAHGIQREGREGTKDAKEGTKKNKTKQNNTGPRKGATMLQNDSPLSDAEENVVHRVIGCAITVHRELGPGFREAIYKKAFCLELESRGLRFECEKAISVRYRQWQIPGQRVDLIVEGLVLVEIKTVSRLKELHRAQVIS